MGTKENIHESFDCLGHRDFAVAVTRILESTSLPKNILLYGSWGTGKTTFLANLATYLQKEKSEQFQVVQFNPWAYESNPNLLLPLLKTIHDALPKEVKMRAEVKKIALSCFRAALDIGVRATSKLLSGSLLEMKLKDFEEALSREDTDLDKLKDEVATCQRTFADIARRIVSTHNKHALVVLLDDLDRCLPDNAIALLEGVKLYLSSDEDTPVIFLWAMDRDIIAEAIGAKYQLSHFTGSTYLEKVFDFQIPVPRFTADRHKSLTHSFFERCKFQEGITALFGEDSPTIISEELDFLLLRNPRTLNRLWDILTVLAINHSQVIKTAKDIGLDYKSEPGLFGRRLLLGVIIAYHFRDWRFDVLQNKDRWTHFIRNCEDDLPGSQEVMAEHHNLFVVLSDKMEISFYTKGESPNIRLHFDISENALEELYKISSLLQMVGC